MDLDLEAARAFLTSDLVHTLLQIHPNDLALSRHLWPFTEPWWAWAATGTWTDLLEYYLDPTAKDHIPLEFRQLIDQVSAHSLPRGLLNLAAPPPDMVTRGMSPKKAHEVIQSLGYITQLFNTLGLDPRQVRIVDIGAGQGYLTRALHTHLGTTHLLALDSSEIQTQGAQRRQDRTGIVGSITQKNIHITPASLCQSIDEWIAESSPGADPVPVFLVALHACGSLTPDLIRAFLIQRESRGNGTLWNPVGVMAIGCCYNLLAPKDFPLSERMMTGPPISLPTSAYHMAAQIPAQWFRTPESRADASLALRKIVWRAIIGARFAKVAASADPRGPADGTGDRPAMRRLGRLNNSVYDDWRTFAGVAATRLGADLGGPDVDMDADEQALSRELEVLHVLRCIIGPLVESVLIMDREEWVREQLGPASELRVEVVNVFDQATGSGRNVALVVAPIP